MKQVSQLELRLFAPPPPDPGFWTGKAARRLIAHLNHAQGESTGKQPVPWALFHYRPDGRPESALPAIRWGGGERCFRIVGLGEAETELVYTQGPILRRLLAVHYGRPIREELSWSQDGVGFRPWEFSRYRAHEVVVATKPRQYREFMALDEANRKAYCEAKIRAGLRRQRVHFGIDDDGFVAPMSHTVDSNGDRDDAWAPRVSAVGETKNIWLTNEPRSHALLVKYIDFKLNAALQGHWAIGGLISRGYGRIERQAVHDARPHQRRHADG